jgi:hypothetical protein
MRRLAREGLLQKMFLPLFGFYPWECPVCRDRHFFKVRHRRKTPVHMSPRA